MRVRCETSEESVWYFSMVASTRPEIVVTLEGMLELGKLLDEAEKSERCRVVVLEGNGDCFCRGMDLSGVIDSESPDEAQAGVAAFADVLSKMRRLSKPIVAMIDGVTLAGGMGFVAVSDCAIATERSIFGLPELMLGLVPAMVLPLLMERMPPQKVRRLALNPLSIDAQQALGVGLIDVLAPDKEAAEKALNRELKNLLRVSPAAAAGLKAFGLAIARQDALAGIEKGRVLTGKMIQDDHTLGAIRDFISGEPLPWFERAQKRVSKKSAAYGKLREVKP